MLCSYWPQITKGPKRKPCKVSDMIINNIRKMSRPMSKHDIVKQNPNGGYEQNQIPAPSNICRLVVYDASIHPSIHLQFSSGLGSWVSSKCMHLVCLCCLVDKILIKLLRKKKKKKKKRKIVYFSLRVKSQETIAISHLTIFFLHLFIYLLIYLFSRNCEKLCGTW
jgi:hypothetical protein